MNRAHPQRRNLAFTRLDDLVSDLRAFDGQEPASSGKWTAAQNVAHVAAVIDASVDGMTFTVPLVIRLFARAFRGWFLAKGFKPGIKFPQTVPASFNPGPETPFGDAVAQLNQAVLRANTRKMATVSPLFGAMNHEQWTMLHCRHAELHFSFIQPPQPSPHR